MRAATISQSWQVSPRWTYASIALFALAGAGFLLAFDPRNPGVYPTCPFLGLTGCYCPGCGTLRALHSLLLGDFAGAMGYNPLAMLSLPFIGYSFVTGGLRAFRLPAPRRVFIDSRWIWTLLAGVVLFWILRNVPAAPWAFLAP